MTFAWMGNKKKQLPYLPIYRNANLIVEPFAGSAVYSVRGYATTNVNCPWICADLDMNVRMLHLYFKRANVARLLWLNSLTWKDGESLHAFAIKHALTPEEKYIFAIYVSGLYVGTPAYAMYDQFKMQLHAHIMPFLHRFRLLQAVHCDFRDTLQFAKPGVVFFVDPPYKDTHARYKIDGADISDEVIDSFIVNIVRTGATVIFTYGNGARERFPRYNWLIVHERSTTSGRSKSNEYRSVKRIEYVTVLNLMGLQ